MWKLASPFLALAVLTATAAAEPEREALARRPHGTVCSLIESAALEHGLPVSFFTRLIWKESSFRPDAVSPKGAQGIAQFMPGTAAMRGLADPFDPYQAIPASASLLSDLRGRFGNLGLAAAAYNAGAERVARWMAGTGYLPLETEDYVLTITGTAADRWAETGSRLALRDEKGSCEEFAGRMAARVALSPPIRQANWQPWGVQVAVNFSQARAVAIFNRIKERNAALIGDMNPLLLRKRNRSRGTRSMIYVRLPAATRAEAGTLCGKLMARGTSCMVLKN